MEQFSNPNIVSFGLRYRRIVLLIASVLIAWGIYGLIAMDKNEFPSFTIREGVVAAAYPGADAVQVEQEVLKPLQDYIFSYKEVNKAKTTAQVSDGMAIVFVTLNDNISDTDPFWNKFKIGMSNFKSSLPAGVVAVETLSDFGNTSALLITMQGERKTYRELHDYMTALRDRLRSVGSIGQMTVYGEQTEQVAVTLSPERLAHYGVDMQTLALSLLSQGFKTTGGAVRLADYTMPIYVARSFNSVNDIKQTIVYSTPAGDVVRLGDVADVAREYPEPTSYITNNGAPCLLLSVQMKEGQNIITMGHEAEQVLREFAAEAPVDVKLFKITDQPEVVHASVIDFLRELLIAIVAVVVVIMLLLPLKVAFIAAMTIPITIFISLGIFYALGIELNTVTLACLIVSLGMIVDNSVVIIDEYVGLISDKMPHEQASINAGTVFYKAIVSATLAISITFFPFLLTMTGMFRDFLTDFPWAILLVLVISLIVAELLVPYLQLRMIKEPIYAQEQEAIASGKKKFSFFVSLQNAYDRLVKLCFDWPKATVGISLALVVVGTILFVRRPIKLMPIAERNQFAVEIYLPAGSSLSATTAIADSLEHMLAQDKRIVSIASFHGMSSPRFQTTYAPQVGGPNYAQFIVNTVSNQATIDLLNEYTPKYQNWFPGAWVKFKQLSYSNAKYQIEVRLTGQNQEANRRLADTVVSVMRSMPGMALVRTGEGNPLVSATVEPDEAAMSRLGLNTSELELNLAMRYSTGLPLGTLWEGDYGVGVVVKTAAADSATVSDLAAEPFSFLGATSTRLSDFASIRPAYHPGMINYRGGNPVTIVTAVAQRGEDAMTQTELLQQRLKGLDIPADVALSYGGEYEQTMEFLPQIGTAMLIAIVIIFFILIFHYRSVSVPSVMILSLLFVIPGAAFGLLAMNEVISLTCSLGMISLMGILVRNVIIMFDYAEELQAQGESVRDATFHAAQRRMRPIFLTSAAATMGVVPMVVSGSALWKPMGIVIFFGTPVTMVFILTVIPILYWKLCGKSQPTIDNPVYPTPEPAASVTNVNQPNTSAE